MNLIIDTTKRENIAIGLSENTKDIIMQDFATQDQSADILPNIEKALKQHRIALKDLETILVNDGPGSFTGVRVGITVANALAWSLDVPVLSFRDGQLEKTLTEISKFKGKNFLKIALPYYPNSKV